MPTDLVERLRATADDYPAYLIALELEAAETILSLRQQIEAVRVEEREQCAKIAVEHAEWLERREARYCAEAFYIAEQIRARNGSSP